MIVTFSPFHLLHLSMSENLHNAARQQQFLNVISRDEATERFQTHLDLHPLGNETVTLPGRDDIPEQGIIYREILRAIVELVLTCTKTAYATAWKYIFFEDCYIFNQAL